MSILDDIKHTPQGIEVLTSWLGNDATPVDKLLAQERTNICTTCPMNGKRNYIKYLAMAGFRHILAIKKKLDLTVENQEGLKECKVCGCDLPTKIWVPIRHIRGPMTEEEINQHPEFCWVRTEPHE